ncbi:hypothetical protein HMPREF0577_1121 [Mobiluncus mulieris ATCC 35243]|nr:hypothetical protein HMPREF0577_1121 [Mobiluncus mulieris ATCC 35243]
MDYMFCLFWVGALSGFGLTCLAGWLQWGFVLLWLVWLVGWFLYSGASICDASFFVLVLVFVLLV